MLNIQDLIDDAQCYETVRTMRWPDGVTCLHCASDSVIKNGRDDTQPHRQRYECHACRRRFDDLTGTLFADHRQPLRTWIPCFYLMGLNRSTLQIAKELALNKDDARGDGSATPSRDRRAAASGDALRRSRMRRSLCRGGT
jgi:transposase-like protein